MFSTVTRQLSQKKGEQFFHLGVATSTETVLWMLESTDAVSNTIDRRYDKWNYIRYWMAGGESEKTSMRVKAAHTQMTADGVWRGGCHPYGYRLVHRGRMGKRNRQLYDLEIDPITGPIIQEIFHLVTREGFGTLRTANYLTPDNRERLHAVTASQRDCRDSIR